MLLFGRVALFTSLIISTAHRNTSNLRAYLCHYLLYPFKVVIDSRVPALLISLIHSTNGFGHTARIFLCECAYNLIICVLERVKRLVQITAISTELLICRFKNLVASRHCIGMPVTVIFCRFVIDNPFLFRFLRFTATHINHRSDTVVPILEHSDEVTMV